MEEWELTVEQWMKEKKKFRTIEVCDKKNELILKVVEGIGIVIDNRDKFNLSSEKKQQMADGILKGFLKKEKPSESPLAIKLPEKSE